MSYETLAHIVKIGGTVFFTGFFAVTVLYVLWPRNRKRFDEAAQLPLSTDDHPKF
ncbi:MAG: cbb3-type cytochrome oxidase subunit 3 [Alphaproteobacteria bacterium]